MYTGGTEIIEVNSNCSVFSFDMVQLGPGTGRKTSEMVVDLMIPLSNTYSIYSKTRINTHPEVKGKQHGNDNNYSTTHTWVR